MQVFYDQRNDCYPQDVLMDYLEIYTASSRWESLLAEQQVGAVLWPAGDDLDEALSSSPRWTNLSHVPATRLYVPNPSRAEPIH